MYLSRLRWYSQSVISGVLCVITQCCIYTGVLDLVMGRLHLYDYVERRVMVFRDG